MSLLLRCGPAVAALVVVASVSLPNANAAPAPTGTVVGKVSVTEKGASAKDAAGIVVYVIGYTSAPPTKAAEMRQQGHQFTPLLLPVLVGQPLSFPNLDWDTSHNVFSTDPRFNLGQYRAGRGAPPSQTFDTPGPVEIFCNIHPDMAATVLVLPNSSFATTAADGSFAITGVTPGTWEVYAYDRHAVVPAHTSVTVAASATSTVAFALDRTRFRFDHQTWEGTDYADHGYHAPGAP